MISILNDWRIAHNLGYRELGRLIGCPPRMAFAYCQDPEAADFRLPRPARMRTIYRVTGGAIGPAAFYKLPKLAAQRFDPKAPELALEQAVA